MRIATLCCCILAGCLQLVVGLRGQLPASVIPDAEPLFLTPLIKNCSYEEAKTKSEVHIFKHYNVTAKAYSGYITVNDTTENHLFFLFIEAENRDPKAPLMLWTPGGPGLSALFAMLLQNGPVQFDATGNLTRRELTIQTNMSVIYLDAPVGAGLSFTKKGGYAKTMKDITRDIFAFLEQFLQLFDTYKGREFYLGGDSYAARYSVALGCEMLLSPAIVDLKLQGIIGGVGFLAPVFDLADSSEFLLQSSMLTTDGYEVFKRQFALMRKLAKNGSVTAVQLLFRTIFTSEKERTLFQNLTLYNNHASSAYTERPLAMLIAFVAASKPQFKIAIHAGINTTIEYAKEELLMSLIMDWMVDITYQVQYVLNNTRVLCYTGQLDALFPSVNSQAYFEKLNWKHSSMYRDAARTLWKPYGNKYTSAAGYMKSAGNFTTVTVFGMGHYAGFDKPTEIYMLVMGFLSKQISFAAQEM